MRKNPIFITDFRELRVPRSTCVCLGNFDGVHRGHQKIFSTCLDVALRENLSSVLFTFSPHPSKVLSQAPSNLLLTEDEKMEFLRDSEFDFVLLQHFDPAFSRVSAEEFIEKILISSLQVKKIVVGENFRFGKGAAGHLNLLRSYSEFTTLSAPFEMSEGQAISSTCIRNLVSQGEVEKALSLLGYAYFLTAKVERGLGRGRTIGFPTANLQTWKELLPQDGVYGVLVEIPSLERLYPGVLNIGLKPTFSESQRTIEVHILGYEGDLLGQEIRVSFLKKLRDEKKFESSEALAHQIKKDISSFRTFLQTTEGPLKNVSGIESIGIKEFLNLTGSQILKTIKFFH